MSDTKEKEAPLPMLSRPAPTAKRLGWGLSYLYDRLMSGEIESFVDGRARWIVNESVERYIAKQLANPKRGISPKREKVRG